VSGFIYSNPPNTLLSKKDYTRRRDIFDHGDEHTNHCIGFEKSLMPGCLMQPGIFAFFTDLFLKHLLPRLAYFKIAGMNTRKGEAITRLCGREER